MPKKGEGIMAKRETDIAIRRNFFEDTILLIGEFDFLGHQMNYVLRLSSFGSRNESLNLQVYFGLLDDTMRDFSESRNFYTNDQVIVDKERLWIRTDRIEIRDSYDGLKVYIRDDDLTFDFVVQNDGNRSDLRALERLDINNRLEGYSYPYCLVEGSALIGQNYTPVQGTAFYLRRFQNHAGRLDRRTGQTSILRGFSRGDTGYIDADASSLYGFFTLANGKRLCFGSFGDGHNQDDFLLVNSGGSTHDHRILPIQVSVNDSGDPDHPDKDVLVMVQTENDDFIIKARRVLTRSENLSMEKKDFLMFDRFARLTGTANGSKISGHGVMVLT